MTTININKLLLEQVQDLLYQATRWKGENHEVLTDLHDIKEAVKAVLAAPATAPEQMPPERDCICHQYLHLDAYSGGAAPEGLYGALWVVVEGVRKKYVLADQSSEPKDMPALATTPKQPRPFVPWSKEAEMLESWAAQPATAPDELEQLRKDSERMREALMFYAEGDHFTFDRDAWDTVSDEPQNYWCDEAGTATVEDGTIAKLALDAAMKGTP